MSVTSLAVGIAGVAWADSPDPVQNSAVGHIVANPPGAPAGAVTISVEGNWTWPTHRSDCNTNRFAAGYAVDWNDPNDPGPVTLTGKNKQGQTISADPGTTRGPSADPYTHYNGGLSDDQTGGPRCGVYSPALGYNSGHWGPIEHTYTVPPANISACVVTYDLHDGNAVHPATGEAGVQQKDTLTSAGDNSIESNGSTPGGNQCAQVIIDHPLSLKVTKTNDANADGTFSTPETAATAGANVPFKVTVENTSAYAETVDGFADTVGGVPVPGIGNCVTAGGANLVGTAIAPGGTATCTFTAPNYSPAAGTDKTNTVTIGVHETSNPNNTKTGTATSTVSTLNAAPLLTIKKTGPKNGVAGGTGTYTLVIENTGNATAKSPILVTDTLDPKESFVSATQPCTANGVDVSCVIAQDLAPTNPVTHAPSIAFDVVVKYADNATGDVTDCATVKNGNADSAKSCATTNITPDLAVNIVKTNDANGDGTFSDAEVSKTVGADVKFRAVISNPSKVPVKISSLTDEWSGHAASTITCVGGGGVGTTLAVAPDPASSTTCTWTENGYSPADGGSKVNTVRTKVTEVANPANESPEASDSSTVATSTPKSPDLLIAKTGPATAVSGTEGKYTITVTNKGTAKKVGPITVTDTLPVEETYVSSSVPCAPNAGPGAQTVSCILNQDLDVNKDVSFTVTVKYADDASGIKTDCAKVDNSVDCADTDLTPVVTLTVVKTNDANLDGTYTGTEQAKTIGQNVNFRALITNTSKVPVQLDSISDAIGNGAAAAVCDANKNAVLAANGGSVLCSFTLNGYAPAAGTLTDTVTVTGHEAADATNKVSASGQSTVIAPSGAPSLTVLKTGPATAVAGSQASYNIKVTNNGTATANAPITVTDTLPSGETFVSSSNPTCAATAGPGQTVTCTLGQSLAVGADTSFTVTVQFANVSGTFTDCAKVGDSQSCVPTELKKPDLSIVKTGPTTIKPGQVMNYTLTVENIGPIPATNFLVTDTLPAGLTLNSITNGAFTCAAGGSINCTYPGVLAPGGKAVLSFSATLAAIYTAPSVINTAVVNPTDDTPQNNTSTWVTPVEQPGQAPPDLAILKTGPNQAVPGGQLTYTLTVTNVGTVPTSGFTVTDPLAVGLSFNSASGAGFTCTGPGVSCTYPGVLTPGSKVAITVLATLSSDFDGSSVINTATVNPPDGTPENNTSTWITPVKQPAVIEPDLAITKAGPATASPGDKITYTLTVRNAGLVSASDFVVTDELPSALTLISMDGSGFTCDTVAVSCRYDGTLLPAGTASITVVTQLSADFKGTEVKNVTIVSPTDGTPENNRAEFTTAVDQPLPFTDTPLPFTGSNTYQLLLSSLALLSVGAALVLAGRRRRRLEV